MSAAQPIRLHLMPDAPNGDGEPRAALLLLPKPDRRPVLMMFSTIAAALELKRSLEGQP